jgi:hypothetical protein
MALLRRTGARPGGRPRAKRAWLPWSFAVLLLALMAAASSAGSGAGAGEHRSAARDALLRADDLLERMYAECETGFSGTCSPESLAATEAARTERVRAERACVDPGAVCVNADSLDALRVEVVTEDIRRTGPLRFTFTYLRDGSMRVPTCAAVTQPRSAAVRRACGPGVVVLNRSV